MTELTSDPCPCLLRLSRTMSGPYVNIQLHTCFWTADWDVGCQWCPHFHPQPCWAPVHLSVVNSLQDVYTFRHFSNAPLNSSRAQRQVFMSVFIQQSIKQNLCWGKSVFSVCDFLIFSDTLQKCIAAFCSLSFVVVCFTWWCRWSTWHRINSLYCRFLVVKHQISAAKYVFCPSGETVYSKIQYCPF